MIIGGVYNSTGWVNPHISMEILGQKLYKTQLFSMNYEKSWQLKIKTGTKTPVSFLKYQRGALLETQEKIKKKTENEKNHRRFGQSINNSNFNAEKWTLVNPSPPLQILIIDYCPDNKIIKYCVLNGLYWGHKSKQQPFFRIYVD